jgi:hypothetical protein
MQWRKERDLLVAQTLAFVQSVAGKKGDARADTGDADARIDDLKPGVEAALMDAIKIVMPPGTARPSQDIPANKTPLPAINIVNVVPPAPKIPQVVVPSEVRAEMQARVANFRAHQERFSRERDQYYNATYAKLRAAIGNEFATPPSRK